MKKALVRVLLCVFAAGTLFFADSVSTHAAGSKPDPKFDYKYYADTYPDLKSAFGYDKDALWNHYVVFGQKEGRKCYPGDPNGKAVAGASRPLNASEYAKTMLEQVNAYRASKGVAPLQLSQKCLDVANLRATECSVSFSHKRAGGKEFGSAYTELGYTKNAISENCAQIGTCGGVIADSIPEAMGTFMSSRRHNAEMLKSEWKYAGFGSRVGAHGNVYVIPEFANA